MGAAKLLEDAFGCRFPEGYVLPNEAEVAVRLVLRRLDRRAEKLIRLRYGIGCQRQSHKQTAKLLRNYRDGTRGISTGRVQQIEAVLLRIIRVTHCAMLKPDIEQAVGF